MIESLLLDIRYALRSFRQAPLFAAGVALTIGLGLGFVCSAFTIVNGYLLKPFDVRDPHALYELSWDTTAVRRHRFNIDEIDSLRANNAVFSDVLAFSGFQIADDEAAIHAQAVTGNYFEALGIQPFLGRVLGEDDAPRPGDRAAVVLSHDAWNARYGADPSIVGREIRLGRRQYTVVGIAQPGFNGFGDSIISFWVPLTMAREFPSRDPYAPERPHMLLALARLRSDTASKTAAAWFDVWVRQRFADAPPEERPTFTRVEPRATRIPITPATATMFSAILVAFGLVLLIACANVANMMLARGVGRQREIAVRMSLGAPRARIVRQLIVESALLAMPAALIGFGLTLATARAVPALLLATWPEGLPPLLAFLAPIEPDLRVVSFLLLASVVAALLFGLVPALHASKTSLSRASRGEFGESVRVSRLRSALIIAQVAACALFLISASGVLSELRRLSTTDTGLNLDRVVDLRVPREYRATVANRLSVDPRVERVAATWRPPLYGPLWRVLVTRDGSSENLSVGFIVVSPEYFDLFGIPLVRGRLFTRDEADTQADVAIVSEGTARRLWPGSEALGRTIHVSEANRPGPELQRLRRKDVRVVGIVRDVMSGSLAEGIDSTCVYFPTGPAAEGEMALLLRARDDMRSLRAAVAAVTTTIREDATFPLYPMRQIVGLQMWALGAVSATVSLLGAIALVLAVSGTYGVVAYIVLQRTREFGIRVALGATTAGIVRTVVAGALGLGVAGIVLGTALAIALSQVLASRILPAFGPIPYIVGALVVLLATAMAASVPSVRASRVDPAVALRTE